MESAHRQSHLTEIIGNWQLTARIWASKSWFKTPPIPASKQTPVPWIIQDIFHDYHGVVWYWREFNTPKNLHKGGHYLLKFHAVDYLADVWVNGKSVGSHEGSEIPFDFNITDRLNQRRKKLACGSGSKSYIPTY